MAGNELSPLRNIICSTCLSYNRKLYPVESCEPIFQTCSTIFQDIKLLETEYQICWECKAILRNAMMFKKKALQAQDTLSTIELFQGTTLSIRTLSDLTISSVNTISIDNRDDDDDDYENYDSPVKTEKIEIEEWDISHTVLENGIVPSKLDNSEENAEKDLFLAFDAWPTQNTFESSEEDNLPLNKISHQMKEEFHIPYKAYPISHEEMEKYREEKKSSHSYMKALYKCELCVEAFRTQNTQDKHMLQHDATIGEFMCNVCRLRFKEKEVLDKHVILHYTLYKCKKCNFTSDLSMVNMHCSHNHKETDSKKSHNSGKKLNHHKCEVCGERFKKKEFWKLHKHDNTGDCYFECDVCHKRYATKNRIREHMRAHDHQNNLEAFCAECGVHFNSKFGYWAHLRKTLKHVTANDFQYKCPHCDKKFPLLNIMRTHVRAVHELAAEFFCKPCNKRYYSKTGLLRHNNFVHKGREVPRDKVCDVCGKAFKSNEVLKQHKNIHLGLKPFRCSLCPAAFSAHGSLFTHVRHIHKNQKKKRTSRDRNPNLSQKERKHQCPQCDKRFIRYKILENHINAIHKRSLDFACQYCSKKFYCDGTLQQHLRKHGGGGTVRRPVRDKICDVCGKGFVTNAVLNQHKNIHAGVRPYACGSCPAAFNAAGSLHNHVAVVHKKTKTWRKRPRPSRAEGASS